MRTGTRRRITTLRTSVFICQRSIAERDDSSQRGDHLIELRVRLPDRHDAELERIVTEWETRHPYDPRKVMGGRA